MYIDRNDREPRQTQPVFPKKNNQLKRKEKDIDLWKSSYNAQWTLLETSSYGRRYASLLAVFAVEEDHIERA